MASGFNEPGFREVGDPGTVVTPVNSGRFWLASQYYLAGCNPDNGAFTVDTSASSAHDFLYAIPVTFSRNGTLTDIAGYWGNPTSGAGRGTFALYDSLGTAPAQPTALLRAFQCTGLGFQGSYHDGPFSLSISAGKTIWFVTHNNAAVEGGGNFNVAGSNGAPWLGWDYNPPAVTHLTPTVSYVGWKVASVYAFPPPDPFPVVTFATHGVKNSAVQPSFFYKFAQSQ